eukprot:tig00020927_g15935.t1
MLLFICNCADVTWGAISPVNSSSLDGTVARTIAGAGFPTDDPALSLAVGSVVVSNLAVASNGSLLSFLIPAPSQNPSNTAAVETLYDIVLNTSCGVATLPKSYIFFLPGGTGSRLQVIGIRKRVPVVSNETVAISCTGCNFDPNDFVEVYIQIPAANSRGWVIPGPAGSGAYIYRGPAGTCGMKAPNATVVSGSQVDFASPVFSAACIKDNFRRSALQADQRALNTPYDVVLVSAQQGPFFIPAAFEWFDVPVGVPTTFAPYQSIETNGLPGYAPAVIIPVVLVICLVGVFTYRRRWRRLREFVDVQVAFAGRAPGAESVAAAIASSLRAPRVAAVGLKGDGRGAVVRVHDAQHRSTGEVRRVTEEVLAWAAKAGPGSSLAGREVASVQLLGQPAALDGLEGGFFVNRVSI